MKMLVKGKRRKRNRFLIWLPLLAALFIFSNIGEAQAYDPNIIFDGIYKATGGDGEVTVEWYQASNSATSAPNWYYLGYNIYCSSSSEVSPFSLAPAEIIDPTQGSAGKKWSIIISAKNNRTYYLGVRAFVTSDNPDPNIKQKSAYTFNTITLTLTDSTSDSATYTNSQTVDVEVLGEDADIVAWLISETQDTQPAINDPEWGGEPTSYTFDTATEEPKTVYIWVKDNDDSINGLSPISDSITLDTSSPLPPDISSSTHSDENTWYFDNDPSFVWTTPQDSSGIAGYSYILDQIAETIPDTVVDTTGNSASYIDVADGIWYFHVRAKDGAGNWGAPDHYQVRIDTTPPPVPTLLLPLNDSATKNPTPTFDWSDVTDDGSGLANYEIEVDNNPDYSSPEYSATPTASTATPGTDLDDDTYYWHVRAKDNVGNESAWTGSWTVRIDTALPTVAIITVTPDPAPARLPGELEFRLIFSETMNTGVTPIVSYDPEGATGLQPCTTGGVWSTTNNPDDTYTVYNDNAIDRTTGDGIATISVSGAQDLAGNVMEPDTDHTFIVNLPITIQNHGAFPKSFNPLEPPLPLEGEVTTISYVLSESAVDVDITIIDDGTGLVVRNLVTDMPKDGGLNSVDWDGKDNNGEFVIIPGEAKIYSATISAQGSLPGDLFDVDISNIKADSTLPVIKIISDDDPILRYATPPENAATVTYETNAPGDDTPLNVTIRIRDSYGNVTPYTFKNQFEGIHDWLWDAIAFPEGLYQYEILAKTLPPKPLSANSKTGIIVILDENNIEWSSADGNVKINSPATGSTIDITRLAPEEEPTEATKAILTADPSQYLQSFMYDIIADPETDFVPPAILTFSYDPALVGKEVAGKLQIRYFDTATNSWVLVERQYVDIANHQIVSEIDHLSLFALFTCDDTTPPVVTITSPEAKEYYHTTDGEPTIIEIAYTAEDPVAEGISTGVVKETVLLNGKEYEYETIDLSTLVGENTLTVKAIDKAGNIGWSKVEFTVALVAQVTIKPEALKVNPGILTAFVEFPEGYDVAYIVDATCDGAAYESMMLNEDATVMIIKFRRDAIEEALSQLDPPQTIDTAFKVRGTVQDAYGTYIFEATDTIMKVLEGNAPPEKGKGKPQ